MDVDFIAKANLLMRCASKKIKRSDQEHPMQGEQWRVRVKPFFGE
jgi:hypothetical protein